MNKAMLSPSIMCVDEWSGAKATLDALRAGKIEFLHADVMDGEFVPNLMLGTESVRRLRGAGIPLDIHLMILRPEDKIGWFDPQPGEFVSVHAESTRHLQRALSRVRDFGAKPMAALNPATPLCMIEDVLGDVDGVLIMTVNPGFAGQKLQPVLQRHIPSGKYRAPSPLSGGGRGKAVNMNTVIGLDYGTLSARAVLVDTADGQTLLSHSLSYPHGVMPGSLASAEDYETVLEELLAAVTPQRYRKTVAGICVDATSLTMVPMDAQGRALSRHPGFEDREHAQIKLWKRHAAQDQAQEALTLAKERGEAFLGRTGGSISSEWTLPKLLETRDRDPEVYEKIDRAMDLCEYLTFLMTGNPVRSAGPMAFKNLWAQDLGFPSDDYLNTLRPGFAGEYRRLLRGEVVSPGKPAGRIRSELAERLGLKPDVIVSAGAIDSHTSPVALGAVRAGDAVLVSGTSTVPAIQTDRLYPVQGVCGTARDVMVPGLYAIECGQACTGEMLDWYMKNALPASVLGEAEALGVSAHQLLSAKIERPWENGVTALDWFNGSRNAPCDLDQRAVWAGLSLETRPQDLYLALLQSIVCGTREILEVCAEAGIAVKRMFATGGVAQKNPLLMREYANILNLPIFVGEAAEGPALGSAIFAAVAAGLYPDAETAGARMGVRQFTRYDPDPAHQSDYERLYQKNHALRQMTVAWSRRGK